MKLRWSPTSPFVRKVMVLLKEKGIEGQVELEKSNPLNREDRAATPNPLGKIPCLIADDGTVLYDSPVILEYLDATCDGPKLLPASGPARWAALRREALADGIMEASLACFIESMRKPEQQSAGWLAHNRANAFKAISSLEGEAAEFGDGVDVGLLSLAIGIAFAEQVFPDEDWRSGSPALASWYETFAARPSMTETKLISPRDFR